MHFSMTSVHVFVALAVTTCFAAPKSDSLKCMDTPRHKATPTPESQLYKTCSAYEGLSCCTNDTAVRVHGSDLYKFQNVVCNNKGLSAECRKYFLKDACFYECSPDITPYVTYDDGKDVVLKNVPLCKSNCNNWFTACQNEFTCTKDWKKAMGSESVCSSSDKCQTIKDKFQNAKDFCEKVWGSSYEVVDDEEKCLRFDNPEKRRAEDFVGGEKEANATESDCQEGGKGSSSPVRYQIVLGGIPLVLSYYFLKSEL